MIIHKVHDLSNLHATSVLRLGLLNITDPNIIYNYSPEFSHINSNIFYTLANGRYITGAYYILEENGKYMASAGWNKYDDSTALLLTRAYIANENRGRYIFAETILQEMIDACSSFDRVWITCNKYNKAIYDWFCRAESGKQPALFNNWPDIYRQFTPIGIQTVYNTDQYAVQLRK